MTSKSRQELIKTGQRFGTERVLAECDECLERWEADLATLAPWGWGASRKAQLEALRTQLQERYAAYKAEVGAKLKATPEMRDAVQTLHIWCEQALSILDGLENEDAEVAKAIQALGSLPDATEITLPTLGAGLLTIAQTHRERLDADAASEDFFSRGQRALDALQAARQLRSGALETKLTGTTEVNELDGRIHDLIGRLNHHARRALRRADRPERAAFYVYNHLNRDASPTSPNDA